MKQILTVLIALFAFQSCTTTTSTTVPTVTYKTIQCQAYKVTVPGNDTTLLEDLDTYVMQSVEPEYWELQWGIKNYSWGYTYCDCWVKP